MNLDPKQIRDASKDTINSIEPTEPSLSQEQSQQPSSDNSYSSDDLKDKAETQRAALIEALVEMDDKLMEKYFAGEEISVDELKAALRKGTIEGKLFPVLGGSHID